MIANGKLRQIRFRDYIHRKKHEAADTAIKSNTITGFLLFNSRPSYLALNWSFYLKDWIESENIQ